MLRSSLWGLGLVGFLSLMASLAVGRPEPGAEETAAPPPTHKVAKSTLTPCASFDGALDVPARMVVYTRLEQFGGPLIVTEAAEAGRMVKKGDVLVRFDAKDLDDAIRVATEALDHAEAALTSTKEEKDLQTRQQKEQMKGLEQAKYEAEREMEVWNKYDSAKMLKQAELGVKQSEYSLDDQKEELAQLESMYKKSELAGETKEIVLDRARRSVKMSEEYLALTRTSEIVTKMYEHPDRNKSLTLALERSLEALAIGKVENAQSRVAKERELLRAEQADRDARDGLQKLRRDHDRLAVLAPCGGILVHDGIEIGESMSNHQAVARIVPAETPEIHAAAGPEAVRWCAEGSRVTVKIAGWPEREFGGKIREVAMAPAAGGDAASPKYTVCVGVDAEGGALRIGLPCHVEVEGAPIKDALWVPKKAVAEKDGKSWVKVMAGGKATPREVTCGPSNETQVQVVKGLSEGDEVVLPAGEGVGSEE